MKKFGYNDFIILLLYVDDMFIVGQDANKIDTLNNELRMFFALKNLRLTKQNRGMKISHHKTNQGVVVISRTIF